MFLVPKSRGFSGKIGIFPVKKEEKNDTEMQLLDDVYYQVEEGGWLDNV